MTSTDIRTLERINPNNTVGFIPDLITAPKDEAGDVIEKALSILCESDDSAFTGPRANRSANAYVPCTIANEYPKVWRTTDRVIIAYLCALDITASRTKFNHGGARYVR